MKAFFITLLWIVLVSDALLLVLIVLLQSGRGGGLSGMLGGGGGAESALGPKTGLPRITGWMAGVFFVSCILIGIMNRDESVLDPKNVAKGKTPTAGAVEPGKEPTTADASGKPTTGTGGEKPGTAAKPSTAADAKAPATADGAGAGKKPATDTKPSTAKAGD